MEGNKEDYYSLGDIINQIKSFLAYLRKKWLFLILAALCGFGLGLLYYIKQKPKYEAFCTFILEEKQSGMGGLSGLASQFGIDVGGLTGGGSIFSGDNILDILRSKKVVTQVLLSKIKLDVQKDSTTLGDFYLEFTGKNEKWQNDPKLAGFKLNDGTKALTTLQDSILNSIYDKVIKRDLLIDRISKKGTIIKVQVTAENDLFARYMAERLVEEAGKMYLTIKTGTAQANISMMQRRSDSLMVLLNNKSYRAAASQPLDMNPGIKTASVPVEIASRDKAVIATLYTEVTKNLEASKMLLAQQTPVMQLLDKPNLALDDHRKSFLFISIISIFISITVSVGFLIVSYLLKSFRAS